MATKKISYPLAMTTDGKKAKRSSKMKKMKPDAFLEKARKLAIGEGDRDIIDKFKNDIKSGESMGPLKLYADGSEDGRHRATAAKELGVDEVPVIDDRTAKATGGALGSNDPNRFMQDILKFSFQILPLIRPGYLKEVPKQGFAHGGHVLEDDYPTHYLPEVGRQVMADGGVPESLKGIPTNYEGSNYPEYSVDGKPYSSINSTLGSPILEKALTWALEKAAQAQSLTDKSTPARLYKEAVLDRRQEPITQKDFSQDELSSLARAVVRSQAAGRNSIQPEDYGHSDGPFPVITGRANYDIDKEGNAVVRDTYDFNNYERYGGSSWPTDASSAAIWLGRRALPSGTRGVPVSINVPKELLENALSTSAEPPKGFADGGSPAQQPFAAMDPSMLVGRSAEPFRGGEAYADVGGQSIAAPFVKGLSSGYPVYTPHDAPVPSKYSGDLPGDKSPFEPLLQWNWLSKLMGYAEGGGVEDDNRLSGDVQFAPPDVEQALLTAKEVAEKSRPFEEDKKTEKRYEPFSVLPLSEDKEGIHFDPYAGLLGAVTRPAKYFYETMSGQKEMDPTSEESIRAATDLAGSLVGGSAAFERPAGALASGASRTTPDKQAAIDELMAASYKRLGLDVPPKNPRIKNPIGMHSAGAEAARALPQEKGTPEQVLAMLRKTVPEHEIEHSGIAEEIAGLPSVNREDVAKHFESKLPQVIETVFQKQPVPPADKSDVLSSIESSFRDIGTLRSPKFEQYSLPGGSNYREVVLHEARPGVSSPTDAELQKAKEAFLDDYVNHIVYENADLHDFNVPSMSEAEIAELERNVRQDGLRQLEDDPDLMNEYLINDYLPGGEGVQYRSGHFNEVPNYLAHVRMKDYELPEGGKGLLLDEVQSDRAQAGRKKGFKTPEHDIQADKLAAQINDISQQKRDLANRIYRGYNDWAAKEIDEGRRPMPAGGLLDQARSAGMSDLYNRMEALDDMELSLHDQRNKLRNAVPSGPYMQDTNHWTDLAIKRALKEAVEGGYNRLMVTPGKEHADRYNMRKVLDRLSYSPDTGELYGLKNNELKVKRVIPKEELESHVGKEIAQRLLEAEPKMANNQAWHVLEGEGLELGGEGMKGFYDKKLLGRLEKLLKKYDKKAKIESYQLPTTGEEKRTVHSIPISDELRRIIQEKGISAFARGGALDLARSIAKGDHYV